MATQRTGDSAVGYPGDIISHTKVDGSPASPDQLSAETAALGTPARPPRRRKSFDLDRPAVVRHVLKNLDRDIQDRVDWSDMRIQRYAKFRGWMEPKDYPWPHASNAHIPLMMTDVLRTEDTIHNAVLTSRPVIQATPMDVPADLERGENVDNLLDYQAFVENKGEELIGELITSFVVDGTMVCYIPWVRDEQTIIELHTFPPLPEGVDFASVVHNLLGEVYPGKMAHPKYTTNPFRWIVEDIDEEKRKYEIDCEFCTDEDDRLQLFAKKRVNVFNGPCIIPKQLEDIVVPTRSSNLQPPSPHNPNGAAHVLVLDYPDLNEIKKLYNNGYYDLMDEEDLATIESHHTSKRGTAADPEAVKVEKDSILGHTWGDSETARETFTRVVAFDRWDIDGDGILEDVIFTIIKESKTIVRARYLNEMFPAYPPRRPFAEARYIAVPGQFYGIGLPELMEALHDLIKIIFDQSIDGGTLANTPWGLYRSTSGIRPEVIRMYAGELYPTSDPKNDISFPQVSPNSNGTWGMNMVSLLEQHVEKLTSLGDLQFGRVPTGKASALRTASTTQTILQQGDARPERILRRFFRGLAEVFQQMHELNKAFLPEGKQYKIIGIAEQGRDPYRKIDDPSQISGRFDYSFKASVLNTDRSTRTQILQQLSSTLVNPMTQQMGIVTPENVYNIFHDMILANGQEPDRYTTAPKDGSDLPPITAEEAVAMIMHGYMPMGYHPAEGLDVHIDKLMAFHDSEQFGHMDKVALRLFSQYTKSINQQSQKKQHDDALLQKTAEFSQQQGGPAGTQPSSAKPTQGAPGGKSGPPMIQPNKPMDMSLPGAGGGQHG